MSSTRVPRTFAQSCEQTAELLHSSALLQGEAGRLLERLKENRPTRPVPDSAIVDDAADAPFGWLELDEFLRLTPAQKDDYLSEVALQLLAVNAKPQSRVDRSTLSSKTALGCAPSTVSRDSSYQQVQIDAQVFLARLQLNQSRTVELCLRSRVNCVLAEQTLARARDLMEKSRELRYGRAA